ncbi:MAG: sulfotransferase [Actinomycetota bacterium]
MQVRLSASELSEAWLWVKLAATGRWDTVGIERKAAALAPTLDDVETFCLFIGYPRSGHSLVSSVLDAHPNALFSHRLNSLGHLADGRSERQIHFLAVSNALRFSRGGRRLTGYQYLIPGQSQGAYERLQVVGDQEGKDTTLAIDARPELLDRLAEFRSSVRFIHALRNPFDNISTWATRTRKSLDVTADRYFELCRANRDIRARVGDGQVFDIRHEAFLAEPAEHLRRLCGFVGLDAPDDYVEACTSIMYSTPNRSRERAPWTSSLIESVEKRMAAYDFLGGYSYED